MICIHNTEKKGRGVFAQNRITMGELIEKAPVIVIPDSQLEYVQHLEIASYVFAWGNDTALVLGYGSLYNHSYYPNAIYLKNYDDLILEIYALRDIKEGEEITINYNGRPEDHSALWFEVLEQ